MEIPEQLNQVAKDVREGRQRWAKIRTLVGWFGAYRRRPRIVKAIRAALDEVGLRTSPDFDDVFLDNYVTFYLASEPEPEPRDHATDDAVIPPTTTDRSATAVEPVDPDEESPIESPSEEVRLRIVDQPSYQVSHLVTARKEVIYVAPDTPITEATTQMHYHEFDQLPVMTGTRSVKGMISWKSIGRANARGQQCAKVAECMEPAKEISLQESIFDAFRMVQRHECVLIKDHTNAICGIVTLHDIAGTFNELAEPFLLIGEIENLLRNLIAANFSLEDIRTVWREGDKQINDVSDMTFGQYLRLLENNTHWTKMPLDIDKTFFTKKLDEVREARNDVMHFEPEGVEPEKLKVLRDFARFLHKFE